MIPAYEVRGRLLGLTAVAFVTLCIFSLSAWVWSRHAANLKELATDRFSLPYLLTLLVLLYFFLVTARAAHEPQYALFLTGRAQEAIFLRKWEMLIAPLVALATMGVGYYQQPWQIPLSLVSWLAALWAIYGVVKDITGAWLRPIKRENYFLLEPGKPDSHVAFLPKEPMNKTPEGYRVVSPTWGGRLICVPTSTDWNVVHGFLCSEIVNQAFQDKNSVLSKKSLKILDKSYELPSTLEKYAEIALIHTRAKGGLLHNEQKIRLRSDPFKLLENKSNLVEVQKTSYYLSVCTNELSRFEITGLDAPDKDGFVMFDFVRKKNTGEMIGLDHSELSNHMGGSTLAITHDGKILLVKQGRLTVVSSGLLAPSGSGSFDWNDRQAASGNFTRLIRTALERELMEECGLDPQDISETILLGMGRDLARGGKPDFFGVTLLNRNEGKFEPTVKIAEVGFVDFHDHIELSCLTADALKSQLNSWINQNAHRCSSALIVNLKLLINANPEVFKAILSHIGSC